MRIGKSISRLFAVLLASFGLIFFSPRGFAQSAVRDDFPYGGERGVLYEHFTQAEWNDSNFATPEVMKTWQDRRYGMFIHFGITARAQKDLSWGSIGQRYAPDSPSIMANGEQRSEEWTAWPADMRLAKFNAKEWVEIARRAGFKYIVVTTKHHEGFHMWDTAEEASPLVDIDLENTANVTGILVQNADSQYAQKRLDTLGASISVDGKEWVQVWQADKSQKTWAIPVTSMIAGACVPGHPARFIRLQTHPVKPDALLLKQLEIWGN